MPTSSVLQQVVRIKCLAYVRSMNDLYTALDKAVGLALLAAFVVRPLDSGLRPKELKQLVVEMGFAPPLYDEAWQQSSRSVGGHCDPRLDGEERQAGLSAVHRSPVKSWARSAVLG
jgi:hypothetical protein